MNDFISREAAEQAKCEFLNENIDDPDKVIYARGWNDCNLAYQQKIRSIPAADVKPVERGKWIEGYAGYQFCSKCGAVHYCPDYRARFCEDCGADMRGETDG